MTGPELRAIIETILPDDVLREVAITTGFHQRDRKRQAVEFLRTMLISATSPGGGRQADLMRAYFETGAPRVVRGSFYEWFGPPLEQAMAELGRRALAYTRAQPVDAPGILAGVHDWRIIDSTTIKLPIALRDAFPGCGDYAAIKVHKTLSVGTGMIVDYHFSPAREHDSPHLVIDESWRGFGLLADLGYASLAHLRACTQFGVSVVIRLKDGWKPKVQRVARADLTRTFVPGTDLELFLDDVALNLGNVIDVDVTVGAEHLPLRLVGIRVPGKGYRFYLTTVGRRLGPHQIADLYSVRWEIESSIKVDKSGLRLDDIDATKPAAVRALLHATLISSVLTGAVVHVHNRVIPTKRGVRQRPPLHHGLVARMLTSAAYRLAALCDRAGDPTENPRAIAAEWERLAGVVVHTGEDPNWRAKPSILDQLRGWRPKPATKRKLSSRMHV